MYLQSASQAVALLLRGLFHGGLHDTSHKPFLLPLVLQLSRVDVRHRRHVNRLLKPYKCADPLTFPFPRHSTWELSVTENQCQSVFRSAVPLGC